MIGGWGVLRRHAFGFFFGLGLKVLILILIPIFLTLALDVFCRFTTEVIFPFSFFIPPSCLMRQTLGEQ